MGSVHELAPAKLNLSLEVVGRRPDGYHDLATVFQTVDLCDELFLEPAGDLTVECDDSSLDGEQNLALRAARSLAARLEETRGARIAIRKRIPIAGGLGGGSADAAAALRGLLRLWQREMADDELIETARELGADVPFLLRGGTALAAGIGDRLEYLPDLPRRWAVLYTPTAAPSDKTVRAYRALSPAAWSDGAATRTLAGLLKRAGGDASAELAESIAAAPNAFESVADTLFPELGAARAGLLAAGAPWARLTGAGPTIFTLVHDDASARVIADRLGDPSRCWVAPTSPALPGRLTRPASDQYA